MESRIEEEERLNQVAQAEKKKLGMTIQDLEEQWVLASCGFIDIFPSECIDVLPSGPRLNIKTVLSTYGDFHVKDKTAVRTSYL